MGAAVTDDDDAATGMSGMSGVGGRWSRGIDIALAGCEVYRLLALKADFNAWTLAATSGNA